MNPKPRTLRRTVIGLVVTAGLLFAAGFAWCLYQGVSTSLEAEKTLHAILLTTTVVDHYVQQEHHWPESWAALHKVASVKEPSCYDWPADAETMQHFISINFDMTLSDVASQTIEQFDAITPKGPCYPYQDQCQVKALIDTAKKVVSADPNPTK